jgi:flagellar protein FlaG
MAMEIQGLVNSTQVTPVANRVKAPSIEQQRRRLQEQGDRVQQEVRQSQEQQMAKIQEAVDRLDTFAKSINKKLSYSFNKELNQVIVKVVDAQTDSVIKELPPAELQRLHMKIQEYIGMIVDETA